MRQMTRKSFAEYTNYDWRAYEEGQERKRQTLEDRPLTLRKMREFYEMVLPEILKQFTQQLALVRGTDWKDPEKWFPAWDEFKADEAFLTIKSREAFDPLLYRARVWAREVRQKEDPRAYQLNKCMDRRLQRCLEILEEGRDLTLLANTVVAWHYYADKLIERYEEFRAA